MYNLKTFIEIFSEIFGEIPESNFTLYLTDHNNTDDTKCKFVMWEMGATSVAGIVDTFGTVERDVHIDDIRVMLLPDDTHNYRRNSVPHQKLTGCEVEEQTERAQYMEIFMHIREAGENDKFPMEPGSPKGHIFAVNKPVPLKDFAALLCPSKYSVQIICNDHYYADFSDFDLLYHSGAEYLKWPITFVDLPTFDENGVKIITIGVAKPADNPSK